MLATVERPKAQATKREADVETLLQWAIGAEKADRIVDYLDGKGGTPAAYIGGVSGDGCFAVERYGHLGTFIDGSGGGGYAAAHLHPDAEHVYRTLREVTSSHAVMDICHHARSGTRPNHTPCPVVVEELRPVLDFGREPPRPKIAYNVGARAYYCPLRHHVEDNAYVLDNARWLYECWYKALRRLEAILMDEPERLERWRVIAWQAPERPWLDQAA